MTYSFAFKLEVKWTELSFLASVLQRKLVIYY